MTPREIKDLRIRLKLTQKELASTLKCNYQTISAWETGTRHPSSLFIFRINKLVKKLVLDKEEVKG